MGSVDRVRCAALVPHLQPGHAVGEIDAGGRFIRRYLPQLATLDDKRIHAPWLAPATLDYPAPIVQHDAARKRTLARYAVVKAA